MNFLINYIFFIITDYLYSASNLACLLAPSLHIPEALYLPSW